MLKFLLVILVVFAPPVVPNRYASKTANTDTSKLYLPVISNKGSLLSKSNVPKPNIHPVLFLNEDLLGLKTKPDTYNPEPVQMELELITKSREVEIKNGEISNLDVQRAKKIDLGELKPSKTEANPESRATKVGLIAGLLGLLLTLICFWCFLLCAAAQAQNDYYAPQTFRQGSLGGPVLFQPMHRPWGTVNNKLEGFQRGLFTPEERDGIPQSTSQSWTPTDNKDSWRAPLHTDIKPEPWRLPYGLSKEQQASILHHKQALTSEGAFRFEYASDNGLAAGEQIEPDGSRVGAYQYKDPSGQLVKLKYRAGKEGFQILEGSHLPKSPEPVAPQSQDNHYQTAYVQQRQQYELQQQYNQQRPEQNQNSWRDEQGSGGQRASGGQYFVQNTNWRPQGASDDDGQYRENEVENKGPHSFGEGYAFAFKG